MRQIALDTETTGLSVAHGHRVIEIGAVEILDRKVTGQNFHVYLNPHRAMDEEAIEVHGITMEFLADKPGFSSESEAFIDFVQGAELLIHNAAFDVGFLDMELARVGLQTLASMCTITDTLKLARDKHPGQKNNLNALCKRYGISTAERTLHGALLDAELLARLYLSMTAGQANLQVEQKRQDAHQAVEGKILDPGLVIRASDQELEDHQAYLKDMKDQCGSCLWLDGKESS